MIYLFKDVERSLSLALYGSTLPKAPYNLVKGKGDDFAFEMLIDKKAGVKVVGFANVIVHLTGFEANSAQADLVNWLCNHFNPTHGRQVEYAFAGRTSHPLVELVLFALLKANKAANLNQEQAAWFKTTEETHKTEIEKFQKANETAGPEAKNQDKPAPQKQPVAAKADKPAPKADKHKEEVTEEYKKLVFSQKITRLNKGKVILPQEGAKNILITSALPYVNNVPHLGNLIGAVLSADVFARYSRLRGNNTIYICGTDQYGTASEIKGITEGKHPKVIVDYYHKIHSEIYENFEIDFDHFGGTATPEHTEIVQSIFLDCLNSGFFHKKGSEEFFSKKYKIGLADRFITGTCPFCSYPEAKGDQCDKCGKLLEPEILVNPKCSLSGEAPERRLTEHFFLDLTTLESEVKEFIDRKSVDGKWSSNSTSISEAWIRNGLQPRSMTRDLTWGVKVPVEGMDNKVFYVWFDAPIGYISITATYTKDWEKWWKNPQNVKLFQFMGKDNVPFHTVMFPATLLGTRKEWTMLHHISTTEYLNYENDKFSKSRGIGVFGDHVKELPFLISCWRYYLLVNRPENSDSAFKWDDFQAKVNEELLKNPGNLCNRVLKYIYDKCDKQIPTAKPADLTA